MDEYIDIEGIKIKILKVCSNCIHSIELGYKEYHCNMHNHEVSWCGTCKKHKLLNCITK